MLHWAVNIIIWLSVLTIVTAYPTKDGDLNIEKRFGSQEEFLKFLEQKQKEKDAAKASSESGADKWSKIKNNLEMKYGVGSAEYWKLMNEKEYKWNAYPPSLRDKLARGEKLKKAEEDKFENEFGRYKERNETTTLDVITAVNQANDVSALEEGDISASAPDFDYRNMIVKGGLRGNPHGNPGNQKGKSRGKGPSKEWNRRKRDARRDRVYLWLDRSVPYEIEDALLDSEDTIRYSLQQIQNSTCITFRPHTHEAHWIKFVRKSGCWSSVGRTFWISGYQEISLGTNCVYPGIIMHEVLHALGFWHEQSRPDRDQYVQIFWENIRQDEIHNFNKYGHFTADILNAGYDYGSIMHYGKYSFAMDAEKPTMLSLYSPTTTNLGQRNVLSTTDILQVNTLYDCKNKGTGWSNWSDFGPCDEVCSKERTRFCMDPKDKTACPNPISETMIIWGVDTHRTACSSSECYAPADGHWNRWGSWGECSVSCDVGTQSRTRECTDPAPKNGGKECVGDVSSTQACEKRSCNSGPNDCTFDVDTEPKCQWTDSTSDDFDWTRKSGRTPSSSTGPDADHTSGSGYYMYIESSAPAQSGWKARLLSRQLTQGPRCMSFAYNMYGMSTGSVTVYVKDLVKSLEQVVFTRSGDQLKGWKVEKFDINAENDYQVIIEAVRGSSFQGDSAIDDIVIKDGTCDGGTTTTKPPSPTVTAVGCYHSKGYIDGKRIFPMVKNFREAGIIDWNNLVATTSEIVELCSAFARQNNYEYFAVEYWGECWTGPTDQINYGRDGEAEDCWPMKSLNKGPFIVGKSYTAMVYKWVNV